MELTFEQHSACASTVARGSSITTPPRDRVSSPPILQSHRAEPAYHHRARKEGATLQYTAAEQRRF